MLNLNIKEFPEELYHNLVNLAKKDHRSLSQEVIHLLNKVVKETKEKRPSILELEGLGKESFKDIDTGKFIKKGTQLVRLISQIGPTRLDSIPL